MFIWQIFLTNCIIKWSDKCRAFGILKSYIYKPIKNKFKLLKNTSSTSDNTLRRFSPINLTISFSVHPMSSNFLIRFGYLETSSKSTGVFCTPS